MASVCYRCVGYGAYQGQRWHLSMCLDIRAQPLLVRAMRESHRYAAIKPRAIPPADSPNRPALQFLFKYALSVRCRRPRARRFTYEGVQYSIAWAGGRMCVVHVSSARILVGAPGARHE